MPTLRPRPTGKEAIRGQYSISHIMVQVMAEAFGDGKSTLWKGEDAGAPGAGLLGDAEFHPYVSITMNVEHM